MKSPCQITLITILQKCHPWLEIFSKVGQFQGKSFRLFAVALRLLPPPDGVFPPKLLLSYRNLAEMCTLQTDKPNEPSCPIRQELLLEREDTEIMIFLKS
jgi:hypothetical protein